MLGSVFMSYRRADEHGFALALYYLLEQDFPEKSLVMDIEGALRPGDHFPTALRQAVRDTDVVLCLIGPRWLSFFDSQDAKTDYVQLELSTALEVGKLIIPILVNRAAMPSRDELPNGLERIAECHAVQLRPDQFRADYNVFAQSLKTALLETHRRRAAARQTTHITEQEDRLIRKIIAEWQEHGTETKTVNDNKWPKHPEFVFRMSGEWQGWNHLCGIDPNSSDFNAIQNNERDRIESLAFQRLIDVLGPPEPPKKRDNKGLN